ncbi:MAG TPA: DUF2062 domain-containing protein [Noviherbaspirillum sp.]|nr:DUF2062 domain-containing protein [Noviherbaspirillum sp.]
MRGRWFSPRFPTPQALKDNRFLRPFARYLDRHFLWQFNRRGVAGGVAVGLFFGILVPFAQIFLAAFAAIMLRVNLPVAAFSTLVSNPLTFPPLYYVAYRLGDIVTGKEPVLPEAEVKADIQAAVTVQQGEITGWFAKLVDWAQTVGFPLATGLMLLAVTAAVIGYFAVDALWKMRSRSRWRHRQRSRRHLGGHS